MIYELVRLFVNKFTGNDKHYLLNRDNLMQPILMQLSQKQKSFSQFFLHFQNSYPLLNICQKKMTFIAEAIPQIPAP